MPSLAMDWWTGILEPLSPTIGLGMKVAVYRRHGPRCQHAVLEHHTSRLLHHGVEAHADLALASGTHLVVMHFHQAHLFHGGTHGRADIVQRAPPGDGESRPDARTVTDVPSSMVSPETQAALRVDLVAGAASSIFHLMSSKMKNSGLGAEIGGVTDTGGNQVFSAHEDGAGQRS